MWIHLLKFAETIGNYFITAIGTTDLGLALGLMFTLATAIATLRRIRTIHGSDAMVKHWQGDAKVALRVSICCALIVYGPILAWKTCQAIYDDHVGLVTRSREQMAAMHPGNPKIRARTLLTTDGSFTFEGRKHQFVWTGIEIVNPDGPPSSLGGMRMYLSDGDHLILPENLIMPSLDKVPIKIQKSSAGNKTLALKGADECIRHEEPIPTGGRLTCWMWSSFADIPQHSKVIVELTDVRSGKSTKLFSEVE